MAGDRVNPGKDILEIETFDGDMIVAKDVKYRHGMVRSANLGVQLRQSRPMPVYVQYDASMPAVKSHSVIHVFDEPESPENGDGWEINRVMPAISYDEESAGNKGGTASAIAQSLLFLVGLAALLFTGWHTWELSKEVEETPTAEIPAGTTVVETSIEGAER